MYMDRILDMFFLFFFSFFFLDYRGNSRNWQKAFFLSAPAYVQEAGSIRLVTVRSDVGKLVWGVIPNNLGKLGIEPPPQVIPFPGTDP